MYTIQYSNKFRKDIKRAIKRGYDISLLEGAIELLQKDGKLPEQYKPHKLSGKYAGLYECHIKPDWLLVWDQNDNELILLFLATGTHSDLF
jgi:mRNA interferase YafQ